MPQFVSIHIKYLLILLITIILPISCQDCRPFGVRLNFGTFYSRNHKQSTQLLGIRFNTKIPCAKSYISIQKSTSSIRKIYCTSTRLQFPQSYITYVQQCSITDIKQGQNIQYMAVGWSGNHSDPQIPYRNELISYYFPRSNQQWKMVTIADWSYLREMKYKYKILDDSFQYLLKNDQEIRALFINGDIAYDLQTNNGQNYQDFIQMLSQVSHKWPVIINPGNHQHRDNNAYIFNITFQHYMILDKRVTTLKLPYFNFVLFDPYQILYNKQAQNKSYPNYRKHLDESYKSKNLTITASHYPFRCNGIQKDCIKKHQHCIKKHQQIPLFYSAMFQTNVPLYLGGHYHAYERHYPFKADNTYKIDNGPYQWRYDQVDINQRSMISIVEGVAGNDVMIYEEPTVPIQDFTAAYKYNVTGYGILRIGERLLSFEHYTTDDANRPVDKFVMALKREKKMRLQLRTE